MNYQWTLCEWATPAKGAKMWVRDIQVGDGTVAHRWQCVLEGREPGPFAEGHATTSLAISVFEDCQRIFDAAARKVGVAQ